MTRKADATRYDLYLEHFGSTVPVAEFLAEPRKPDLVALRHDVDYDIDAALLLAEKEYRRGSRSTYFVLHTAPYWDDPSLIEKCLQLQDFGHEVGLHVNALADWYLGETDDIAGHLEAMLEPFRSAGVDIKGVAAHGDPHCYSVGFTNYWMWSELRPDDPKSAESGVNAEGRRANGAGRSLSYPDTGHSLTRPDGASFDLWSIPLAKLGLTYEASRVPSQNYYSDSGGGWKQTPDPMGIDMSTGRHMVLMHPLYWLPPQQHYYFLSTARSGSKWLANFLDTGTSVTARHEYTLNHRLAHGMLVPDKRTGAGFTNLLDEPDEAARLIHEARDWSEALRLSYAECNIYLEQFLPVLPRDEQTSLIHLYRDPRFVVRSLLQRDWYNVPFDDRHPPVAIEGWEKMSQIEQICWYVRDVYERLQESCRESICFEKMVADPDYLTGKLEGLGITIYPRLAEPLFQKSQNATANWDVPPVEEWSEDDRQQFVRICGPIAKRLGYDAPIYDGLDNLESVESYNRNASAQTDPAPPEIVATATNKTLGELGSVTLLNASLKSGAQTKSGDPVISFAGGVNSYVLLGGGRWHGVKAMADADPDENARLSYCGWPTDPDLIHTVKLRLGFGKGERLLRLLCLSYGETGELIAQRDLATLTPSFPEIALNFRPSRRAVRFNLALLKSGDQNDLDVEVAEFVLARHWENRSAGISVETAISMAKSLPSEEAVSRKRTLIGGLTDLPPIDGSSVLLKILDRLGLKSVIGEEMRLKPSKTGHKLYLLGGGSWNSVSNWPAIRTDPDACNGWRVTGGETVRGEIVGRPIGKGGRSPVYLLEYGEDCRLLRRYQLGSISNHQRSLPFKELLSPRARYVNLCIRIEAGAGGLLLKGIEMAADVV